MQTTAQKANAILSMLSANKMTRAESLAYDAIRDLMSEVERLCGAIEAIRQATLEGKVCDDVAWFSDIETLHDFCASTLARQPK